MHHNAPSFSNNKSSQMKFDSDDEPDVFELDKDIACITPSRFKPDLFDEINGNIVKYENESTSCDTNEPERTILIALDSLKHGFYELETSAVLRVTHRDIDISEVVLHPQSLSIRFRSRNSNDSILKLYGDVINHEFLWHVPLAGPIETDSLQVRFDGRAREFVMRKQDAIQWGRLSSSTSNIQASNYSTPRNYGPSLSSYRYSASSYTPSTRGSTATTVESGYSSGSALSRSTSSATTTASLTRSSSISSAYHRSPYITPAASRGSAFTPSSCTLSSSNHISAVGNTSRSSYGNGTTFVSRSPSNYSMSSDATSRVSQPVQASPPAVRSRSSSAIASYRSVNVAQLNQQAKERAERDEKVREYKEWEEREKLRENEDPLPAIKDFRKKSNGSFSTSGYSQFSRSVASRSELGSTSPLPPPPEFPKYNPSYSSFKPTATVQPLEDRDRCVPAVLPGYTGLRNIGNTCFMNATLQMLVNNIELKTYFLDRHYKIDINTNNPLGFRGRLADAFAEFMRQMWNCQNRAIEPAKIKELVAEKASQFANFAQHDAHEFLSFLLDGLHEDLNRVKIKPLTATVEGDGRSDIDVSNEAWRNHTLRNDSIFVDLFHGQLKSRLQCPNCDRVSITFDPFVYLPVPFPKIKKSTTLYFWSLDPLLKPVKVTVQYSTDGTIQDLLTSLSDLVRVPSKSLRLLEVFSHRIQKVFLPTDRASDICSGDVLYAFQVHDAADCNETVVELLIIQRQLYSSAMRYACSECGKSDGRLKACEACYNAYYCNKECQVSNWNTGGHREECRRRSTAESVGQPFLVSLPKSQLSYQQLIRVLEARCRFSVDIFQPPQFSSEDNEPPVRDMSDNLFLDEKKHSSSPSTNAGCTPRRQSVLPEPRKKSEQKMFLVRKLADQTRVLGDTIQDTKTGEPLVLESGTYLSINWYNLRNGRPFISVESRRTLDIDVAKSEKLAKQFGQLSNDGSGDPTLLDMLGMFSETERLKPEESWYCNRCKEHVEATKKLELYRLPPILIIQLKRFVYTATYQTMHRRSKDERRVIYPINSLDMSLFLADSAPTDQSTMYDLTGVICHSGSSYFGHYVSIGRLAGFNGNTSEVDWRLFDDSIVSKQSASGVQSDDAYLLFYKQRGFTTRSIFRKHYSCDPIEKLTIEKENGNLKSLQIE